MNDAFSTIPSINHTLLEKYIGHSAERKVPLFIWGTFGIGKSFTAEKAARQIAKARGLKFSNKLEDINKDDVYLYLSLPMHLFDLGEVKGLAFPNADKTKTVFLPSDFFPTKGQGMILLDELPNAIPIIQANAYQLILDRRLGTYKLPDGFAIFGAGNKLNDRANTFEMAYPLKNRFTHVELSIPSVEDWVLNFAHAAKIDLRIINYLKANEGHLHMFNPDTDEEHIAIPTPRTWEFLHHLIKDVEGATNDEFVEILAESTVGHAVGLEFSAFNRMVNRYDVATIFRTGDVPVPKEPSELYSLITALVSYFSKKLIDFEKKPNELNSLKFRMLDLAFKFNKEHTMVMLSQVIMFDKKFLTSLEAAEPKKIAKISKEVLKYLRED